MPGNCNNNDTSGQRSYDQGHEEKSFAANTTKPSEGTGILETLVTLNPVNHNSIT